jgi:hypothetical protein
MHSVFVRACVCLFAFILRHDLPSCFFLYAAVLFPSEMYIEVRGMEVDYFKGDHVITRSRSPAEIERYQQFYPLCVQPMA